MDDFGRDPQVRTMRLVFRAMEDFDNRTATAWGLEWTDPRLRSLRRSALAGFPAQANRLARSRPLDAAGYQTAYEAAFEAAGREMGMTPDDARDGDL